MADFMTAVKWMKDGKKVRRRTFCDIFLCRSDDNDDNCFDYNYLFISYIDKKKYRDLQFVDIEATDWEIYTEEPEHKSYCIDHNVDNKAMECICDKEDGWNLADNIYSFKAISPYLVEQLFKTYIRKVKEDINKNVDKNAHTNLQNWNLAYIKAMDDFKEILDRRSGEL